MRRPPPTPNKTRLWKRHWRYCERESVLRKVPGISHQRYATRRPHGGNCSCRNDSGGMGDHRDLGTLKELPIIITSRYPTLVTPISILRRPLHAGEFLR